MPAIVRLFFAASPKKIKEVRWSDAVSRWSDLRAQLLWDLNYVYRLPSGRVNAMSDLDAARLFDFETHGRKAPRLAPDDPIESFETLVLFRVPPSEELLARLNTAVRGRASTAGADSTTTDDVDSTSMEAILKHSAREWWNREQPGLTQSVVKASLMSSTSTAAKRPRSNYQCHNCGTEGDHFSADCPLKRGEQLQGPIFRTPHGIPTEQLRRVTEKQAQAFELVYRKPDQTLWVRRTAIPKDAAKT